MAKNKAQKLKEISKLKSEIVAMGGKLDLTSSDLNKIEKKMYNLKFERDGLLCQNSEILKKSGKTKRLKYLNQVIPKLEVQLRLDRASIKFKRNNKMTGTIREGLSVQKIGKSKIQKFLS